MRIVTIYSVSPLIHYGRMASLRRCASLVAVHEFLPTPFRRNRARFFGFRRIAPKTLRSTKRSGTDRNGTHFFPGMRVLFSLLFITLATSATLNACQRELAYEITSIYENSTPQLQFSFCAYQNDQHGVTSGEFKAKAADDPKGFPGFTTRDGDALELITLYNQTFGYNNLTAYISKLQAAANTDNDVPGYCTAWASV